MATPTKRPKLGEWVSIKKIAYKSHEKGKDDELVTTWLSYEAPSQQKAMYIGYRKVRNGTYETIYEREEWDWREVGKAFVGNKTLEVWLFIYNERELPVYAFPCDTEYLTESEE